MLPSDYMKRQCWISFDPDESMLSFTARSPLVGPDRIIWASDYPHPDAKFPGVTEELAEALEGLDFAQQQAITSESAIALYGIGDSSTRDAGEATHHDEQFVRIGARNEVVRVREAEEHLRRLRTRDAPARTRGNLVEGVAQELREGLDVWPE